MKKIIQLRLVATVIFLILFVAFKSFAYDYNLSFTATGASTSIQSIIVQNLTQGRTVTVPEGGSLILTNVTAVNEMEAYDESLKVYPNPIQQKSTVSFYSWQGGNTQINIFGLDGRNIKGIIKNLSVGFNRFQLSLPKGAFTIQINENGILHTAKVISQTNNKAEIEFIGSENTHNNTAQKVKSAIVPMDYKNGDLLLFKAASGNYFSILSDIISSSKTINFNFVECKDADGNYYPVVTIGTQMWMAENLKTSRYRNNVAITNKTSDINWGTLTTAGYSDYSTTVNKTTYGKLYNWYALNDNRNIAPPGWHVPTDSEWTILSDFLGGSNSAGNKIKETGNAHWVTVNTGATNETGFNALPGGFKIIDGSTTAIGNTAFWWSLTEGTGVNSGLYRSVSNLTANVSRAYYSKSGGMSIRCVMGDFPELKTTVVSSITSTTFSTGGNITFDGNSTIIAHGVCWSKTTNPTINDSITSEGFGTGSYQSSVNGLDPQTTYYLRAYATNNYGTGYGNQLTISTLSPPVKTSIVSGITASTAICGGNVTLPTDGTTYTSRGVCWSTNQNPTTVDNKTSNGTGTGNFISSITNLTPATQYYVRAYAITNSGITIYGNQVDFTSLAPFTITTTAISNLTAGTANSGGNIVLNIPTATILARGVCWGTVPNPTINYEWTENGNVSGIFSSTITDLKANTKYYIRAYVTGENAKIIYGNELSFTTQLPLVISITTQKPSGITLISANSGGSISTTGPGSISARGVCYSTASSPTIDNNKTLNGTGSGVFTSSCSGLSPDETIYLKAYATSNSGTTTYGDEITLTTLKALEVSTVLASNITATTATSGGTVVIRSGTVAEKGICWSTAHYPTILDSKISSGSGAGTFTSALTGLAQDTIIYVRAYAKDGTGKINYGQEIVINTLPNVTIITAEPTDINDFGATIGGTLINNNTTAGLPVAAGYCWGTTEYPIVIDNMPNHQNTLYKAGTFSIPFKSLLGSYEIRPGTKYYVRAYAYATDGIRKIYGNQVTFTTTYQNVFSVSTTAVSSITQTSAIAGGTLSLGTLESAISRGICWGLNVNPTINDNKIIAGNSANTWISNLTGLSPGVRYYLRAYSVKANNTVVYGKNENFNTLGAPVTESGITVLTSEITYLTPTSGAGGGTVTNSGTEIIVSRGVKVNFNVGFTEKYATTSSTSFELELAFPYVNTNYGISAFVKTASGKTIYGNTVVFSPDNYSNAKYATGIEIKSYPKATSAVLTLVKHSNNQVSSYGFVYSTSQFPTIKDNVVTVDGLITASNYLKGLKPNTIYYVRGFIIFEGQVLYLGDNNFRTLDSDQFMVTTKIGGGSVGTQYMGGRVDVWEPVTIISRGVCYSQQSNPTITSSKVLAGVGPGDFSLQLVSLIEGTYYYCRAFATSQDGYTSYGNEIKIFALAYVPPPPTVVSDPGTIGVDGENTGGGTTYIGPKYFIFGRVYGPATANCNEGSFYFSDVKGIGKWIINGSFDYNSYVQQKAEMEDFIRTKFPGDKYTYSVEVSYDFCKTAKFAVIIQYTKKIPAWDCYSIMIVAGYGTTAGEALNQAVTRKNNDINGAKSATYQVLQTISW